MPISYLLAQEPIWVLIDLNGEVAGGGYIKTMRSLNKDQQKATFVDPDGKEPWPNPIVFDLNGTHRPIYFEFDSDNPNDTYFLEAYNAQNNLLWSVDKFFPGGSGGGGDTTTFISLQNYITNNQFIDHIDDTTNPVGVTNLVIAPSNHKGFTPALINPVVGNNGVVGPDIRFVKNNTAAADQITFPLFDMASFPLTGDVTPVDYVRYQNTTPTGPIGETYKAFQFPITQKVKNLSQQDMTFTIWAAVTATPVAIQPYIRQYFGSAPTASSEVLTTIGAPITLSTTWTQYVVPFTVPDVSTDSLGTPGEQTDDDAVYIQIGMPLNTQCDILFTKPGLFLGDVNPESIDFESYDQINAVNSTPRTADVRVSLSPSPPKGWVAMNDTTIGNIGSGANGRANQDTFQLYSTLYTAISNTYAPVSTGRTPPGNDMASAITDFLAGKTLALPLSLGRTLAGAGAGAGLTATVLGQNEGVETITLTGANMPMGVPFNSAGSGAATAATPGAINVPANNSNSYAQGSGTAFSIIQPTSFMNVFIKL